LNAARSSRVSSVAKQIVCRSRSCSIAISAGIVRGLEIELRSPGRGLLFYRRSRASAQAGLARNDLARWARSTFRVFMASTTASVSIFLNFCKFGKVTPGQRPGAREIDLLDGGGRPSVALPTVESAPDQSRGAST
jgi:hypothetical protein